MAQIHFEEIAQNFANVQQGDKRLTRDRLSSTCVDQKAKLWG